MFLRFLLFLSVLLCVNMSWGQDPFHYSINKAKGLPSDEVFDIFQDKTGFVWIATNEGLHRYDGYSFTSFKSGKQTSVSGSCIKQDVLGRIWYENFDGYLYYTSGDTLASLSQSSPVSYLPYGIVDTLIFITQREGIDVYGLHSLKLLKTFPVNTLILQDATADSTGYYLLSSNVIYKVGVDFSFKVQSLPTTASQYNKLIYAVDGNVYATSTASDIKGIYCYSANLEYLFTKPINISFHLNSFRQIGEEIWLATSNGLYPFFANKSTSLLSNRKLFHSQNISSVILNRDGSYWFGTTNAGILVVPDLNNNVYKSANLHPHRLATHNKSLFVGTKEGELLKFDCDKTSFSQLDIRANSTEVYYLATIHDKLYYTSSFFAVGSAVSNKIALYNNLAVKAVAVIDDKYYVVARSGSCRLLPHPNLKNLSALSSSWDRVFQQSQSDDRGNPYYDFKLPVRGKASAYDSLNFFILFGTNMGVFYYDTLGVERELTMNGSSIYAKHIWVENGRVYTINQKGILCVSNYNSGQVLNYVTNNQEVRIAKKIGAEIYMLTNRQFISYNCLTGKISNFKFSIDPNIVSDFTVMDSTVWVTVPNGITSFQLTSSISGKPSSFFRIDSTTVNGSKCNLTETTHLAYNQNNILIHFTYINFAQYIHVPAYYRLNDGAWKPLPDNFRSINFQSLTPGNYNVSFYCNGSVYPQKISFVIAAPIWQTWWFYALCFIVVTTLAIIIYQYRMRRALLRMHQQKEKIQLQQELSKSTLTAIRSQMNPHFFFNALNTIQAYIVTNNKEKASGYLAKFSMLTRLILEMSETDSVPLSEEVESLKLYLDLEKMRFGEDFIYELMLTNAIPNAENVEIPSMIVQPYVENAIKHGLMHREGEKRLKILFDKQADYIIVTINDNGIGRVKSAELNKIKHAKYKSFSTKATEKRLALLNAGRTQKVVVEIVDNYNDRNVATGTHVTIRIPLENV